MKPEEVQELLRLEKYARQWGQCPSDGSDPQKELAAQIGLIVTLGRLNCVRKGEPFPHNLRIKDE